MLHQGEETERERCCVSAGAGTYLGDRIMRHLHARLFESETSRVREQDAWIEMRTTQRDARWQRHEIKDSAKWWASRASLRLGFALESRTRTRLVTPREEAQGVKASGCAREAGTDISARCRLNLRIMERAVQVREARREDCPEIRQLIQELADFEEMPNGPKLDCAALQSDGFERERPEFGCLVAVCEERIVGYALYFNVYTTLDRKAVHLEDLYVSPDFRKRHVGSRLFDSVAKRTFDEGCQYLDFTVLSWNPAQGFYKAKGAVNVTEAEGWHAYRLDRRSLLSLASRLSRNGEYVVREATSDDLGAIGKLAKDAHVTLNVRISKYKKPKPDEISVISADETIGDKTSDDYYGYFVVESRRRVVGYALYCCAYSTWERLAMYLQELHVSPNEHSTDMKVDLMAAVAKRACEEDRCRVDFWVLDPKNDGQFYTSVGATDLTEIEEWNMYRLYELTKKPA